MARLNPNAKFENKTLIPVDPFARLVPNGIVRQNGEWIIRFTLMITPSPNEKSESQLCLQNWPSGILNLLRGQGSDIGWDKIGLSVVLTDGTNTKGEPIPLTAGIPKISKLFQAQSAAMIPAAGLEADDQSVEGGSTEAFKTNDLFSKLDRLWRQTIEFAYLAGTEVSSEAKPDTESWEHLAASLRASTENSSVTVGDLRNPSTLAPPAGEKGQRTTKVSESGERMVHALNHHPHADLALALEYDRAEEVALALRRAVASCEGRADAEAEKLCITRASHFLDTHTKQLKNINDCATKILDAKIKENIKYTKNTYADEVNELRTEIENNLTVDGKAISPEEMQIRRANMEELESWALQSYRQAEHNCLFEDLQLNRKMGADAFNGIDEPPATGVSCASIVASATNRQGRIVEGTNAQRFAHWETHADAPEKKETKDAAGVTKSVDQLSDPLSDGSAASQAYFTIQSTPALARLYCLAFDLEARVPDEKMDQIAPGDDVFVKVTPRDFGTSSLCGASVGCATPWTLARITRIDKNRRNFLPATRAEATNDLTKRSSLRHGFKPMSYNWKPDGTGLPRFDLTSLDLRAAAQNRVNSVHAELVRKLDHLEPPGQTQTVSASVADTLSVAYQTAGMVLLDREALIDKAAALNRKVSKETNFCEPVSDCTIDADDLMLGLRIDVGIPERSGKGWATKWKPLCNRHANYGKTGDAWASQFVDKLMPRIAGYMKSHERVHFDAATIALPDQLIPHNSVETAPKPGELATTNDVEIFVPQDVSTWTGAPLGVDIIRAARRGDMDNKNDKVKHLEDKKDQENYDKERDNAQYFGTDPCKPASQDILPFGRILSLPRKGSPTDDLLPPRLRFGWPYRFAARAAFSGGVSAEIGPPAGQDGQDFVYPPRISGEDGSAAKAKEHYFRFLRQRPVGSPSLLLPEARVAKPNGIMGHESAGQLIVRSGKFDAKQPRAKPGMVQRIILPPSLDMEDVVRHGVLDAMPVARPAGAYRGYRWDAEVLNGGFPVVCTVTGRGFNGVSYPLQDRSTDTLSSKKAKIALHKRNPKFSDIAYGDAVLEKTAQDRPLSATQYFPDPCADVLMIALKLPGSATYLPCKPFMIDLRKEFGGFTYPNLPPVVITVKAGESKPRNDAPTHDKIKYDPVRRVRLEPANDTNIARQSGQPDSLELVLYLHAGESFDADCWFVPSMTNLRDLFALPQAITLLDQICAGNTAADDSFKGGLRESIDALAKGATSDFGKLPLMGPGGLAVKDSRRIEAVASLIHDVLLQRPLTQLAGCIRFVVAHASNRLDTPVVLPVGSMENCNKSKSGLFAVKQLESMIAPQPPDCASRPVRLHRVSETAFKTYLAGQHTKEVRNQLADEENQAACYLTGDIEIDLARCSGFDIVINGVSLTGPDIDNVRRTRAVVEKRSGTWPIIVDTYGRAHYKTVRQIYGFDVKPDGAVELPREKAILFEVRGLPSHIPGRKPDEKTGRTRISLEELLYSRLTKANGPIQAPAPEPQPEPSPFVSTAVTPKHIFSDPKSRWLEIFVHALPRTAELLRTAPREENGDFIPAEPMEPAQLVTETVPASILLPGTRRPAQPETLTPLPRFDWRKQPCKLEGQQWLEISRTCALRVPLERGWYSAGDRDQIGLVIWPPDLLIPHANKVDENGFAYKAWPTHEKPRDIFLDDFRDEDLGTGGQYVTRWGADPLREGQKDTNHFIQAREFDDHEDSIQGGTSRFAPFVSMPLFETDGKAGGAAANAASVAKPARFMNVGLLLYTPRFDPATDRWYIDIKLRHPSFDQPFIRLGLVRYNPDARSDLQVSQPIVRWGQLLPGRSALARWSAKDREVHIRVCGTSSLRAKRPDEPTDGSDSDLPLNFRVERAPVIYGMLFRETVTPNQEVRRTPIEPPDALFDDADGTSTALPTSVPRTRPWFRVPIYDQSGEAFIWALRMRDFDPKLSKGERLVLFLEEVEHRRPATYADEPVTLEQLQSVEGDVFAESGPRFSVRLELGDVSESNDKPAEGK